MLDTLHEVNEIIAKIIIGIILFILRPLFIGSRFQVLGFRRGKPSPVSSPLRGLPPPLLLGAMPLKPYNLTPKTSNLHLKILLMRFFQLPVGHMGVNRSRAQITVTKQFLNRTKVCTSAQKMGCK